MGTLLRHSRLARNRGGSRGNAGANSTLVALQGRQNQWFMTTNCAAPVFGIKAKQNGGQLGGLDNLYFKSFGHLPSTELTAVLFYLDLNLRKIVIKSS